MTPSLPDDETASRSRAHRPEPTVYSHRFASKHLDPDAVKVIRRLRRHGYVAYLVGGGVRDLLLGRRPKDFDVATTARPHEVRRLFRNCRVIGRRFRLAHILFGDGKIIEVATFRRDPMQAFDEVEGEIAEELSASGGVRPRLVPRQREGDAGDLLIRNDNVFGEPHEDAIRRDFTINGLFYDLERGEVLDYVGGVPDLERRVVRSIGAPDVRFREDPVRMLRAVKFAGRLDFGLDPDLYDAVVAHRGDLFKASPPRLLEEIFRLMRGGAARRSVFLSWELGVLSLLLPEVAAHLEDDAEGASWLWGRLDGVDRLQRVGRLPRDASLLTNLLLGPLMEEVHAARDPSTAFEAFVAPLAARLSVPRRMRERMRLLTLAQRRLRMGKLGGLRRRDYFQEAVALYALDLHARGEPAPDWLVRMGLEVPDAEVLTLPMGSSVPRPRRRRRRRR